MPDRSHHPDKVILIDVSPTVRDSCVECTSRDNTGLVDISKGGHGGLNTAAESSQYS